MAVDGKQEGGRAVVQPVRNVRDEELAEGEAQDRRCRAQRPAELLLAPRAWQRFEDDEPALDAYVASMRRLGMVQGRQVLDTGCGDGWLSVVLAKRGALVYGFDISREATRIAHDRAKVNEVSDRCRFVVASFYAMPFRHGAFLAVIGSSILHHLQHKTEAAAELARVMRQGARAVFTEPFGNNLWLERLRLAVPVAPSTDDPEEWRHQFKYADLEPFTHFFYTDVQEFQVLSRLDRIVSSEWFVRFVNRLDRWLLAHAPALRPLAREVVVELCRRDGGAPAP